MQDTKCQINLKTLSQQGRRQRKMYVELKGTQEATENALHTIERSLVASLDENQQGRALYYMAFLNEHRSKDTGNKIVHQYCYHFKKEGMRYMLVKLLPKYDEKAIGILIGKGGSYKKWLMKKTSAYIEINADCRQPHCVIYAEYEDNVAECSGLIDAKLMNGKQGERGNC